MGTRIWCLLLALALFASCSRTPADQSNVGVNISVSPTPLAVGPATVQVTLSDSAHQPITGARVSLEGNMSHAGMVPVNATAHETAPGTYVADMKLTMSGDWVMIVRADLPNGQHVERQLPIGSVS